MPKRIVWITIWSIIWIIIRILVFFLFSCLNSLKIVQDLFNAVVVVCLFRENVLNDFLLPIFFIVNFFPSFFFDIHIYIPPLGKICPPASSSNLASSNDEFGCHYWLLILLYLFLFLYNFIEMNPLSFNTTKVHTNHLVLLQNFCRTL